MRGLPFEEQMQAVWLELYLDNFSGALAMLEAAAQRSGDPRYIAERRRVQGFLAHLATPDRYAAAYEAYYARVKRRRPLAALERRLRALLGRRTRNTVARVRAQAEFRLLEAEIRAVAPRRVLDAGCGEGRVAVTLGALFPAIDVHGVEVSATNLRLAGAMNRFGNVTFHHGLLETVGQRFPEGYFDLAYSFAVLEHVADVDAALAALLRAVRPGGRCCIVVPMNDFTRRGTLPRFEPLDVAGHVRAFDEPGLRARFGRYPGFRFARLPGEWRPGRYPEAIVPVDFGSFFVAFSAV